MSIDRQLLRVEQVASHHDGRVCTMLIAFVLAFLASSYGWAQSPGVVSLPAFEEPPAPKFPQQIEPVQMRSVPTSDELIAEQVEPQQTIELAVGRTKILRLRQRPIRDQVADPSIVSLLDVSETDLSLTGLEVGATVMNFWIPDAASPGGQKIVSYLVRVLDDPEQSQQYRILLAALEQDINRSFPDSVVQLSYVGRQVVVRGQARDVEEAASILRIVERSLPDDDAAEQRSNAGEAVPGDGVNVTVEQPGGLFLGGVDANDISQAGGLDALLRGQTPTGANGTQINNRVVNLLEVDGVHQVMLKVTVAEVNRSAVRAIGADLSIGDAGDTVSFLTSLPAATATGGTFSINAGDFRLAIDALKQLNLAKSLAEPNLVTLNGQVANFQVGGSFPIPVVTGATATGLQGVQFQNFGVQLNFTPIVTDKDRIRLNLLASVSTVDESAAADVGGTNVPGLNTRNFSNTVELRHGQTLAIAGLIQSGYLVSSNRFPFVGDTPVIGRLFSSDRSSYDEQELIVLVTPYLVDPIHGDAPFALPGADLFEPDDLEFYLKGRITGCRAEDYRTPVRSTLHRMKAFRRLEQQLIIGQPGHSNGLLCPAP